MWIEAGEPAPAGGGAGPAESCATTAAGCSRAIATRTLRTMSAPGAGEITSNVSMSSPRRHRVAASTRERADHQGSAADQDHCVENRGVHVDRHAFDERPGQERARKRN